MIITIRGAHFLSALQKYTSVILSIHTWSDLQMPREMRDERSTFQRQDIQHHVCHEGHMTKNPQGYHWAHNGGRRCFLCTWVSNRNSLDSTSRITMQRMLKSDDKRNIRLALPALIRSLIQKWFTRISLKCTCCFLWNIPLKTFPWVYMFFPSGHNPPGHVQFNREAVRI